MPSADLNGVPRGPTETDTCERLCLHNRAPRRPIIVWRKSGPAICGHSGNDCGRELARTECSGSVVTVSQYDTSEGAMCYSRLSQVSVTICGCNTRAPGARCPSKLMAPVPGGVQQNSHVVAISTSILQRQECHPEQQYRDVRHALHHLHNATRGRSLFPRRLSARRCPDDRPRPVSD